MTGTTATFVSKFRILGEKSLKTQPATHFSGVVPGGLGGKFKHFQVDSTLYDK